MIELLLLGKRQGWERLKAAVEEALKLGVTDAEAVRHLLDMRELARPRAQLPQLGPLERYERPLPQIEEYDQLLDITGAIAEVAP